MKTYTQKQLNKILRLHKLWLEDKDGGVRANLREADLKGANLTNVDLSYANLSYTDLSHVNLKGADLTYSNLRNANLFRANLRGADLKGANLNDANLKEVDIDFASLTFYCCTLSMITDDRIKIQYLYHAAKQCGGINDPDLKKLFESKLFKKVVNKFHRVDECGRI